MSGLGKPGPVPNRSEDLARDPSRKGGDRGNITKGVLRPVTIPDEDPEWHDIAKMLWRSLQTSGQSDYYQDSDWAFAYSLCDDLTFYKNPLTDRNGELYHKRSGQMLQTIYSAMERLLVTEGDRRRVRIELTAPESGQNEKADAVVNNYEQGLAKVIPLHG